MEGGKSELNEAKRELTCGTSCLRQGGRTNIIIHR